MKKALDIFTFIMFTIITIGFLGTLAIIVEDFLIYEVCLGVVTSGLLSFCFSALITMFIVQEILK